MCKHSAEKDGEGDCPDAAAAGLHRDSSSDILIMQWKERKDRNEDRFCADRFAGSRKK